LSERPVAPVVKRQPVWFLVLFALAAAGGAVAYVPLLTVLLPQRIAELQGGEDVAALARVGFVGAVMASLANIGVGMLSDRARMRRPFIIAGLVASNLLLLMVGTATSVAQIVVLVMVWQVGLNLMLSPLMAWAGDCFPDEQKGMLGGALALAPALGALAGSLVTWAGLVAPPARLALVAVLVSALVLPEWCCGCGRRGCWCRSRKAGCLPFCSIGCVRFRLAIPRTARRTSSALCWWGRCPCR
jgi:MFS family permease